MACWCKGNCPVIRNVEEARSRDDKKGAERLLKNSLMDNPTCVEANLALVELQDATNRAIYARPHLRRALEVGGSTAKLALVTAGNARSLTEVPKSVELFKIAYDAAPDSAAAAAGYISAMEAAGDKDGARTFAGFAVKKFTNNMQVLRAAAAADAAAGDYTAAIRRFHGNKNRLLPPAAWLELGRYKDRSGAYDEAWTSWDTGKRMLRDSGRLNFDQDGFNTRFTAFSKMASKKRLSFVQAAAVPPMKYKVRPIFIMGFPRSGTTMTETAIAAHSAVVAGDELPYMHEVVNLMPAMMHTHVPYPEAMMASGFGENLPVFGLLRDLYMRRAVHQVGKIPDGVKFFTDKMPLNEMHIPLISRLFPDAPIFYVRRHPLDVIVSNFSYYINHGWGYSASMEAAAYVYRMFDELLLRYRDLFPGKIHEINYEHFVMDHHAVLDVTLGRAGLEPEPACYDFHLSPRFSRTISHRQIKEPVYDRSVGRYKNYLRQLEPVIDQVRPIIEREGYEI